MITSIIAALTQKGVIGVAGILPWNIKEEMAYFKRKTIGYPIIMGRKTFESIGVPLPKRTNLVITRNPKYKEYSKGNLIIVNSLQEAVDWCEGEVEECFIIGGAQIYKDALDNDIVDKMYLNFIKYPYPGDTLFPEFNQDDWVVENVKESYDEFIPTIWTRKPRIYQ
jgi:dihydrofolate reductase